MYLPRYNQVFSLTVENDQKYILMVIMFREYT